MQDVLKDVRYSWRQLRRTPGITAIAVLTLALGIAATTSFVAVVDALVFAPVRAMRLDQVYVVQVVHPTASPSRMTAASADVLAANPPQGVSAVGTVIGLGMVVQSERHAERVLVEVVSGDYAGVIGLRPALGASLSNDASTDVPDVVISDRLWRQWYGGEPEVVGVARIRVSNRSFRVAGVAPPGVRGLGDADVWIPRDRWSPPGAAADGVYDAFLRQTRAYTRLTAAADPIAVASAMTAVLAHSPTPLEPGYRASLSPASAAVVRSRGRSYVIGWLALGLSGLVLAAACANLANMLYARGAQRGGEVAVRLAVGATRARIARLFLVETTQISLAAAGVGFGLAVGAVHLLGEAFPALTLQQVVRMGARVEIA